MRNRLGPSRFRLFLCLSIKDLRHEWLLNLCMILSIAAIIGPLLILFGLKFGTMETMRHRLLEDPRNREIRPLATRTFTPSEIQALAKRPDVGFIMPLTRQLSASGDISLPHEPLRRVSVTLAPSGLGDPLLEQNGCPPPQAGEAVLSEQTANLLELEPGDTFTLHIQRRRNDVMEEGLAEFTLTCCLPIQAGSVQSVYLPLSIMETVEQFKDGVAAPPFSKEGGLPVAEPVFHSVLLMTQEALGPEEEFKLINNTGFAFLEEIDVPEWIKTVTVITDERNANADQDIEEEHTMLSGDWKDAYKLTTGTYPARMDNILLVQEIMMGRGHVLMPMSGDLQAELFDAHETSLGAYRLFPATPFSAPDNDKSGSHTPQRPLSSGEVRAQGRHGYEAPELIVSADMPGGTGRLRFATNASRLDIPVHLVPSSAIEQHQAYISIKLLGILQLAESRPLFRDADSGSILMRRQGYPSFRLYANRLEDVELLRRDFTAMGIPVAAESEKIADVTNLEDSLTLLFWLIALASLGGGLCSLASSTYAGIERKRTELMVLRLLGVGKRHFFLFSFFNTGILAICGFVCACLIYGGTGHLIDALFRASLGPGESFCRLTPVHFLVAAVSTLLLSSSISWTAAGCILKMDPASALRQE